MIDDGTVTRVRLTAVVCGGLILSVLGARQASAATRCEDLAQLHAPQVTITMAASVNSLEAISTRLAPTRLSRPLCRVQGFISPTRDSHIGFEVSPPRGTASWRLSATAACWACSTIAPWCRDSTTAMSR
jgi:hypothetical protein